MTTSYHLRQLEPTCGFFDFTFKLTKDSVVIGRKAQLVDILLPSVLVSRKHIELRRVPVSLNIGDKAASSSIWKLHDLGSTNGVYINDQKVPQHGETQLTDGDKIKLGIGGFIATDKKKSKKKKQKQPPPCFIFEACDSKCNGVTCRPVDQIKQTKNYEANSAPSKKPETLVVVNDASNSSNAPKANKSNKVEPSTPIQTVVEATPSASSVRTASSVSTQASTVAPTKNKTTTATSTTSSTAATKRAPPIVSKPPKVVITTPPNSSNSNNSSIQQSASNISESPTNTAMAEAMVTNKSSATIGVKRKGSTENRGLTGEQMASKKQKPNASNVNETPAGTTVAAANSNAVVTTSPNDYSTTTTATNQQPATPMEVTPDVSDTHQTNHSNKKQEKQQKPKHKAENKYFGYLLNILQQANKIIQSAISLVAIPKQNKLLCVLQFPGSVEVQFDINANGSILEIRCSTCSQSTSKRKKLHAQLCCHCLACFYHLCCNAMLPHLFTTVSTSGIHFLQGSAMKNIDMATVVAGGTNSISTNDTDFWVQLVKHLYNQCKFLSHISINAPKLVDIKLSSKGQLVGTLQSTKSLSNSQALTFPDTVVITSGGGNNISFSCTCNQVPLTSNQPKCFHAFQMLLQLVHNPSCLNKEVAEEPALASSSTGLNTSNILPTSKIVVDSFALQTVKQVQNYLYYNPSQLSGPGSASGLKEMSIVEQIATNRQINGSQSAALGTALVYKERYCFGRIKDGDALILVGIEIDQQNMVSFNSTYFCEQCTLNEGLDNLISSFCWCSHVVGLVSLLRTLGTKVFKLSDVCYAAFQLQEKMCDEKADSSSLRDAVALWNVKHSTNMSMADDFEKVKQAGTTICSSTELIDKLLKYVQNNTIGKKDLLSFVEIMLRTLQHCAASDNQRIVDTGYATLLGCVLTDKLPIYVYKYYAKSTLVDIVKKYVDFGRERVTAILKQLHLINEVYPMFAISILAYANFFKEKNNGGNYTQLIQPSVPLNIFELIGFASQAYTCPDLTLALYHVTLMINLYHTNKAKLRYIDTTSSDLAEEAEKVETVLQNLLSTIVKKACALIPSKQQLVPMLDAISFEHISQTGTNICIKYVATTDIIIVLVEMLTKLAFVWPHVKNKAKILELMEATKYFTLHKAVILLMQASCAASLTTESIKLFTDIVTDQSYQQPIQSNPLTAICQAYSMQVKKQQKRKLSLPEGICYLLSKMAKVCNIKGTTLAAKWLLAIKVTNIDFYLDVLYAIVSNTVLSQHFISIEELVIKFCSDFKLNASHFNSAKLISFIELLSIKRCCKAIAKIFSVFQQPKINTYNVNRLIVLLDTLSAQEAVSNEQRWSLVVNIINGCQSCFELVETSKHYYQMAYKTHTPILLQWAKYCLVTAVKIPAIKISEITQLVNFISTLNKPEDVELKKGLIADITATPNLSPLIKAHLKRITV